MNEPRPLQGVSPRNNLPHQPKDGASLAFPRVITDWQEALSIRDRYQSGRAALRELAAEYGISHIAVWKLANGHTYKNPSSAPEPEYRQPPRPTMCPTHGNPLEVQLNQIGAASYVCPRCLNC